MNHLTELCPIALHEQLGFWQKILVPFSSTMGLLLAFVVLVVLTIVFQDTATIEARQRLRLFHYHAEASAPLIDYLEQQFSQGVLHPKIY